MGFIRGTLITFLSIVLFFSLLLMNLCLAVSLSLQHDALQPALKVSASGLFKDSLNLGSMFSEEEKAYMQNYCLVDSQYSFSYENYNFVIPSEIIEQGEDGIVDYILEGFIDQIYYTEYDCEFWQCVKNSQMPLVLLSEKAKEYWNGKFLLLLGLSLLIFGLTFLLSRKRPVTFIVTGILMIISALPFRNLDWILKFVNGDFSAILSVFFTQAHSVFIIILILGILFIIIGILCKIFGWKLKFKKDEEEVKGNLQKKKKR